MFEDKNFHSCGQIQAIEFSVRETEPQMIDLTNFCIIKTADWDIDGIESNRSW